MIKPAFSPSDRRRWLLALLAMMVLLYVGLALTFPLPSWLPRGRVSIGTATGRSTGAMITLALIGCALYACYVGGALVLWRGHLPRMTRWIWLGALAAAGALAWTYPVTSTDIFDYLFRSRMLAEYGANPYLVLPNQFKTDPWFRYIGWPNAPSAYGPLWEMIGVQLAHWGGTSLLGNVLLLKALVIGAWAACGSLIQQLAGQRRQQLALYVWMWSPLALWEFAANGHNDGLLIVSLLLALVAVRRNKHWAAVLALTAGALFKFLPALFLPLVVLQWMRRQRTWSRRLLIGAWSLLLFAVPVALLYTPFWDLPAQFAQLPFVNKLSAIAAGADATLRNIRVREGFLNAAPLAVVSYLLQTPASVAQINALLRPAQPLTGEMVRSVVSQAGTILLVFGLVWQCWQVWRHDRWLIAAFSGLLLWYVLASQWFQPWYVLWLLPLYALRPDRTSFVWLTAWALMAQGSYLLQYIVFPRLEIRGQTLEAQVWYVLAIYGLPLLAWMWAWWQRQRGEHTAPAQADTAY